MGGETGETQRKKQREECTCTNITHMGGRGGGVCVCVRE